jgi:hypothetical protein
VSRKRFSLWGRVTNRTRKEVKKGSYPYDNWLLDKYSDWTCLCKRYRTREDAEKAIKTTDLKLTFNEIEIRED